MKKILAAGMALLMSVSLVTSASMSHAATATRMPAHSSLSVLLYIDGSLGDLGFFDSAHSGVLRAQQQLGSTVKVVQNNDSTQWQSQLLSLAASHRYDLMVLDATDPTMGPAVGVLIKRYPHQRIVDFDDNQYAKDPSVSAIVYKQNEGSFLAGALAAMVAGSHLKYSSGKKIIGMVGGMNIPVIRDFEVGYVAGAHAADPSMTVRTTFIGGSGGNDTWSNKPAGARLARSFYNQGAGVVYAVAGGSGLGVLQQATISNRYAIGVDSNQDMLAPGHVIGSVVKRVDNSVFDLIKLDTQGKLQGAHIYYYGL
ncbi:MAG TPA: BMP family ABC transporter substrate-binding protein, partial [Chloroflexota bacterium]|nr:BMP family ABC transporter substrate-binding protein [Chloroflexota bacterium]